MQKNLDENSRGALKMAHNKSLSSHPLDPPFSTSNFVFTVFPTFKTFSSASYDVFMTSTFR